MKKLDGTLFSIPRETETIVQKILEVSQRRMSRETEGTREESFRTSKINSDTTKASRTYRSTLRRCTFRYGLDLWLTDAGNTAYGPSIKGLIGITRVMIEGHAEIKNVFPADVASSLWQKPVSLKEKSN